jgi:sugar lactone lactonase YvrE
MKLALLALGLVASSSFALVACLGSPSADLTGSQESANTEDGGPREASAGDGGGATTTDASAPSGDGGDAGNPCATLKPGPFTPASIGQLFQGSEDLAFDGKGNIAGKKGNNLILVNAQGSTTLAALPGQTYGVRFHQDGKLIAAIPGQGKLVTISPAGVVKDLLTGLGGPNGVYVDLDKNIWVTEFNGSKVDRLSPDGTKTVFASGTQLAQAANGVVIDASKKILFYSEYAKGKINRMASDQPNSTVTNVATITGAALDGMVLDSCGNVYAVDQGSSKLYRVRIDANGNAAQAPELLAQFPTNVANAQFGAGPGFDPKKLYVTGNPGTVYTIDLGITGAPVAQPVVEEDEEE